MSNQSILRITRELSEIQKGPDLSLAVACRDIDVRQVRALIIGPPDTPYEFGFFEFAVKFGREYPTKPPAVTAVTTNSGRTRFNPNIYSGGKVCLSILGTWRGERGEEWSSAQGLESILISIQSLMSSNPYENEPGFEDGKSEFDKKNQVDYVAKIRHETLRISIIERLEDYLGIGREKVPGVVPYNADDDYRENSVDAPFEPFKDLCKRRFLWYYDSYLSAIEIEKEKHADGKRFDRMPFEGAGNIMEGCFQYTSLKKRLETIYEKLNEEMEAWGAEGQLATQKELSISSNLQRQYEQIVEFYKNNDSVTLDLELVDKNPFVWQLVLFGRPMTNLDGGMFRIKLYLSTKFPDTLPRIKFETPIFHHRVSKDGILCYNPTRKDDLKSHIEAIIEAVEEESPAYDPRTLVNPEAAKLFWGTADEKKLYNRKLRRSVQESTEY
ncbi:UBC-like protein [Mytilinidion resinicola]|uniref:Ubiquitin-conjugating enzyme E2 Z n=1 Tax=Mytilinidion resinicola TaxID=574789 RepID=A0A6A6YFA8_9PEZI|nr:UBC-like protein [Mytilinidion resinicola]KAF2806704.1 UBC-like protein [Mytilinidion resinicola]